MGDRHLQIISNQSLKCRIIHMVPTSEARLKEIHKNRLVPHEVLHPRPCFTAKNLPIISHPWLHSVLHLDADALLHPAALGSRQGGDVLFALLALQLASAI